MAKAAALRAKAEAEVKKKPVVAKVIPKGKPADKPKKAKKSDNPLDNMTQPQLRALLKKVQQEESRRTYSKYVEYAHTPNGADKSLWLPAKALLYLCGKIQDFIEIETRHAFDILILSMPPQHGKSMSITETLPSWFLGKWPDKRVILASYNDETAERFCRRNKEKIRAVGKDVFGIEISPVIDRATEFEINKRMGRMISRGVMAGITSNPCELMIIDDPVKNRQEADSETYRERQWEEWLNTLRTRLSAGAKVIVIMTRWHEDDLAGRLMRTEQNVTVINLPCEAEKDDPLGRTVGEALAPELGKDNVWLADFKHALIDEYGTRVWNSLYQGHPSFAEGNLIKREWWQYYDDPTDENMKFKKLPELQFMIMSVDAAFKDGENSDPVSIQVWGSYGGDYFLVDNVTQRLSFSQTVSAIRSMHSKYPQIRAVFIEDKANGSAIIDVLQKDIRGIFPVNPLGGKVARVNAVSGRIEAKRVHLPKFESFTQGFIDECAAFPNGAHDDQCDGMSQALSQLIYHSDKIPVSIEKKLKWTKDMREDYRNANKADREMLLDRWGRPN